MNAVIFDLFETLVTEWDKPQYTTKQTASDLGVDFEAFRIEWQVLHGDRYLGKMPDVSEVYRYILRRLGVYRDEKILLNSVRKREECKKACFDCIDLEIVGMLSVLKTKGLKLGLISNCSAEEVIGLKDSVIYSFFDAIVLSCETGMVKPDIEIFKHCLSLLSEKPSECIFVGDDGSGELEGAMLSGITPLKALWYTKRFNSSFDKDKSYPGLYEPCELMSHIFK